MAPGIMRHFKIIALAVFTVVVMSTLADPLPPVAGNLLGGGAPPAQPTDPNNNGTNGTTPNGPPSPSEGTVGKLLNGQTVQGLEKTVDGTAKV